MKNNENNDNIKIKKADETTGQQNKIDDGIMQRAVEPSLGLDKSRLKDSTKIDSMKSVKKKDKDTNKVNQTETEKQAEPIRQEPESKEQEKKQDNK